MMVWLEGSVDMLPPPPPKIIMHFGLQNCHLGGGDCTSVQGHNQSRLLEGGHIHAQTSNETVSTQIINKPIDQAHNDSTCTQILYN